MNTLPASWSTKRLLISDSTLVQASELARIFNSCNYVEAWDPTFYIVSEDEIGEHISRSIEADEGADQVFRMQTIRSGQSGDIMGYFHLMHGAPQPDIVWISMLVIDPKHQRKELGQEAMEGLFRELQKLREYSAVRLETYLKNWPALRFWIRSGFRQIIEYDGHKQLASEAHASLVLERSLGR